MCALRPEVAEPEALLYAFTYDSIHGKYPGSAEIYEDTMNIDGDPFRILSEKDPANLPWGKLEVAIAQIALRPA